MSDLKTSDFNYQLPESLIAKYPLEQRSASRLMCLSHSDESIHHQHFSDLADILQPNDLLVFNNTKVIPARLYGEKLSGGKVECLIERIIGENTVLAHIKASKAPKPGTEIIFASNLKAVMTQRHDALFELEFIGDKPLLDMLEQHGHMPLPPYIDRADEVSDMERYQTVYAKHEGAVAAPTAGLHFDDPLLAKLKEKGIQSAQVTLHVGAGTFQPVRVDNINDHHMHSEYMILDQSVCDAVTKCREQGGRVIAVGTTSIRCLETASKDGSIKPYQGDTDIFIYPGFKFNAINGMITNFHLPESTLIMLVSAFAGREFVLKAYETAVQEQYRFYSYGDAMLVL